MIGITQAKRQSAFEIWTTALAKYDIKVFDTGQPFRNRWGTCASDLSDELVFVADILWAISNSLTEKSTPICADKIRQLVLSRSEKDYLMKQSELEIPGLLASRVSPIAFEPAVPLEGHSAAKPSSSDHSVLLPCGEVFIEATTMDLRDQGLIPEAILKKLVSKLTEKRRQACRDRVYLLALKILGVPKTLDLIRHLVNERVWPNRRFCRYGGIFALCSTPHELGHFKATWLPNSFSMAPAEQNVGELFNGGRSFHLHRVKNLECTTEEVEHLRRRVAKAWSTRSSIALPVLLIDGPLDCIKVLLKPTQVGDTQITFAWDFEGNAKANHREMSIPPHGPVQVTYRRRATTRYEFAGFRLWMNELRPTVNANDYLPRLVFCP